MKKSILFVAALLCGAMAFAEEDVISVATNDDLASQLGWVSGTSYPTFDFNEYISAGCGWDIVQGAR